MQVQNAQNTKRATFNDCGSQWIAEIIIKYLENLRVEIIQGYLDIYRAVKNNTIGAFKLVARKYVLKKFWQPRLESDVEAKRKLSITGNAIVKLLWRVSRIECKMKPSFPAK